MAERFEPDDTDADTVPGATGSALGQLEGMALTMKVVAAVASVLWAVTAVSLFWTYWDSTGSGGFLSVNGAMDDARLVRVVGQTLQASWGWALVAVVAAAASALLTAQRLRFLLGGLDREV